MEAKIKKKRIIFLAILTAVFKLYAQNDFPANKIMEFGNDKQTISIRQQEDVAPQDDETGNKLFFNDEGSLFIYNWDKSITFKLSDENSFIKIDENVNFSDLSCMHGLHRVSKDYLYYTWTKSSYLCVNQKTGERKFKTSINDLFWSEEVYYDESTDILFFRDNDSNMYSIIHPSLNDEENRKNYKNPEETLKLFNTGYDMKNLGLYKDKYLTVDGQVYYWAGTTINHINYQIFDNRKVNVWNEDFLEIYCTSDDEEIESIAIHPCGDIYILRMNWQTNTHNLYCIENIWDPQWRKDWYKEHQPDSSSQQNMATNLTTGTQMTCTENLDLRSEGTESGAVITTMKKGTKVKILKLGNTETIDGITGTWVQVEVLSGAKDQKGKKIKAGTTGWCFGGYLE